MTRVAALASLAIVLLSVSTAGCLGGGCGSAAPLRVLLDNHTPVAESFRITVVDSLQRVVANVSAGVASNSSVELDPLVSGEGAYVLTARVDEDRQASERVSVSSCRGVVLVNLEPTHISISQVVA